MNKNIVTDWKLRLYLFGDLPAAEHEAIAALEASDSDVRGRIDKMREERAKFLEEYPPEVMLPKIERMRAERLAAKNANKRQRGLKCAVRLGVAVAACVAAAFIIVAAWKILPPVISHVYTDIKKSANSIGTDIANDANFRIDSINWQGR